MTYTTEQRIDMHIANLEQVPGLTAPHLTEDPHVQSVQAEIEATITAGIEVLELCKAGDPPDDETLEATERAIHFLHEKLGAVSVKAETRLRIEHLVAGAWYYLRVLRLGAPNWPAPHQLIADRQMVNAKPMENKPGARHI